MKLLQPMLLPLLALIAGILLAMTGCNAMLGGIIILLGASVSAFLTYYGNNPKKQIRINPFHYIWLLLTFCGVGIITYDVHRPTILSANELENIIAIEGRVCEIHTKTSGEKAIIDITKTIDKNGIGTHRNSLHIILKDYDAPITIDDNILATITLRELKEGNSSISDRYLRFLLNKGIYYETSGISNHTEILSNTQTVKGNALHIREKIETLIEKTPLQKPTQNFLITVLCGDRAYLNPGLQHDFADAGISHILALSGMHMGIIASIFLFLLFPVNYFGLYRWRIVISAAMLLGYAYITGMAPSTMRACIMALSMAIAIFIQRKNSSWNSLLLAAFIILLFDPSALFDVGFQLSFMCVMCLIFFMEKLNPINHHEHNIAYRICEVLLGTIVATVGTWCISAYYFEMIPVTFLISNILILPLLPFYLTLCIITIILSSIGIFPHWLINACDCIFDYGTRIISTLSAQVPAIHFSPSLLSVILWIGIVFSLVFILHGNKRNTGIVILSLFCIGCGSSLAMDYQNKRNGTLRIAADLHPVTIKIINNNREKEVTATLGKITELKVNKYRMLCIASKDYKTITNVQTAYDWMIIAGGCKYDTEFILNNYKFKKLIIHPSVRKEIEKELVNKADSLKIQTHSIRSSGAYITEL